MDSRRPPQKCSYGREKVLSGGLRTGHGIVLVLEGSASHVHGILQIGRLSSVLLLVVEPAEKTYHLRYSTDTCMHL